MGGFRLFRELRRRHVYRVAVTYGVTAWLLIEVATQVLPLFDIPQWTLRLLILLLVAGFPIALVLAWALEITPHGVRRTRPSHAPDARPPEYSLRIRRQLNLSIIVVLSLILAILIVRQFVLPHTPDVAAMPVQSVPVDVAPTDKSIAVLPFENLSANKSNQYFADGIQDEILTGLAQIGDLKVISRTSTKRYASRPDNIGEIARQLGVATILEGSVQRLGERVRINVQLIDVASDSHIWAETYDRTVEDMFAVESEVAQRIAGALHAALTQEERAAITSKPTDNPKAYAAYLDARALMAQSLFDRENIERVIAMLQVAVKLDPRFALAWAQLAQQHVWMYWEGFDPTPARLATATDALQHATGIAPKLPQVELARGMLLYYGQRDFPAALTAVRNAQRGLPNDAWVWHAAALLERRLGQWDAALEDFEHARSLNPNDVSLLTNYAITQSSMRRWRDADSMADVGLALKPDSPSLLSLKVFCLHSLGDFAGADLALAKINADSLEGIAGRARQALYRHDYAPASALFESALARAGDTQAASSFNGYIPASIDYRLQLALSQMRAGNKAAALDNYRQVETQTRAELKVHPGSENVKAALHAALGQALAGLGQREEAIREGQRAVDLIPATTDAAEGPGWQENLARIHAINGDARAALPLIEQLLAIAYLHPLTPALLQVDPTWDAIRKDPGFQSLVAQHNEVSSAATP